MVQVAAQLAPVMAINGQMAANLQLMAVTQ